MQVKGDLLPQEHSKLQMNVIVPNVLEDSITGSQQELSDTTLHDIIDIILPLEVIKVIVRPILNLRVMREDFHIDLRVRSNISYLRGFPRETEVQVVTS